jgi:hypothetical protein
MGESSLSNSQVVDWFTIKNPDPLFDLLGDLTTERKLRLFLVACARSVLPSSPDEQTMNALETAEQFGDGLVTSSRLSRVRKEIIDSHATRRKRWPVLYSAHIRSVPAWHATREKIARAAREGSRTCAWSSQRTVVFPGSVQMAYPAEELMKQANFLRDIFGNPFQPISFDPAWRTANTIGLASAMYESREFSNMPILADALEEAGCDQPDFLAHCRGEQATHVRGCWVVDWVLGKS